MGACTSSPRSKAIKGGANFIGRPSTAKVIHVDGRMQELKVPVAAKNITFLKEPHQMGACTSSPRSKAIKGGANFIGRPSTAKVIHVDGRMQELKVPVAAKNITSQNPDHFLCSSESMSINTWVPHVPDEEKLQLGQIYFLLPLSQFHNKPITLKDLCVLAVKASSAIGHDS